MDSGIILLFATVLVIGVILFAMITFGKHRGGALNVDKYRTRWMEIEQSVQRDSDTSYRMAIVDADKLVDQALKDMGYPGQTMAERLKSTRGKLSRREDLWAAHKLRNRIVHEEGVHVNYNQVRRALNAFKHTLKDLGAI